MNEVDAQKIYSDISNNRKDISSKYYNFHENYPYNEKFKILTFSKRELFNKNTTMQITIMLSNRYKDWSMSVRVVINHTEHGIFDNIEAYQFSNDFIYYEDVVNEAINKAIKKGWL